MRKIKVWDKVEKIMYPFEYVTSIDLYESLVELGEEVHGEYTELLWDKSLGLSDCELIEYTGLKDCNGREIYEGDILRGHNNPDDLVQVVFGQFGVVDMESESIIDNVIGWYTKVIPTDAISQAYPFCLDMPLTKQHIVNCEWEIIGNIYENPEVLNRSSTK